MKINSIKKYFLLLLVLLIFGCKTVIKNESVFIDQEMSSSNIYASSLKKGLDIEGLSREVILLNNNGLGTYSTYVFIDSTKSYIGKTSIFNFNEIDSVRFFIHGETIDNQKYRQEFSLQRSKENLKGNVTTFWLNYNKSYTRKIILFPIESELLVNK